MAASVGASRTRTVLWAVFGTAFLGIVVDGGSCSLARVQIDDDAKAAARHAVQSVEGQPINTATAQAAYTAAEAALPNSEESIVVDGPGTEQDFTLGADGSITLTVQRTAPTLVFKHLPVLKDYTLASVTVTQQPLGM